MDKTLDAAGVLQKLKDGSWLVFTAAVTDQNRINDFYRNRPELQGLPYPPVPLVYPRDLKAWYCPDWFDIKSGVWMDCSRNGNLAILTGSGFERVYGAGHGATNATPALSGSTKSMIHFGTHNNVIKNEFTVCSVTRYTGGIKGRILADEKGTKWLHGHWNGLAGVAKYDRWVTRNDPPGNVRPNTHWTVMCGTNAGPLSKQSKLANGVEVGTAEGGRGDVSLWVNGGKSVPGFNPGYEKSDFAIAEVVVWTRGLTVHEMDLASKHLMESRGIKSN